MMETMRKRVLSATMDNSLEKNPPPKRTIAKTILMITGTLGGLVLFLLLMTEQISLMRLIPLNVIFMVVFLFAAVYSLSIAGLFPRLPYLREGMTVISVVYAFFWIIGFLPGFPDFLCLITLALVFIHFTGLWLYSKETRGQDKTQLRFVFLAVLRAMLVLNLGALVITNALFSDELDRIEPYGQLVEVDGKKMHVYSMGTGEQVIVLLPGSGNPLPSADFGPLMRELSKEYTTVSVEYFGVGFSDETGTPRTNENYMREMRQALSAAGFQPPYILMPHSLSGIYCEYYAIKYPDEVSAIINAGHHIAA